MLSLRPYPPPKKNYAKASVTISSGKMWLPQGAGTTVYWYTNLKNIIRESEDQKYMKPKEERRK